LGQLNILQRKKGAPGSRNTKDAFKTIGVAFLPLHDIANSALGVQDRRLRLQWCLSDKAYLIISAEVYSENDQPRNAALAAHKDMAGMTAIDDNDSVASSSANSHNGTVLNGQNNHSSNLAKTSLTGPANTGTSNIIGMTGAIVGKPPLPPSAPALFATSTVNTTNNTSDVGTLRRRIEELESAVLNSADVVEYERGRAREAEEIYHQKAALLGTSESSTVQVRSLQQDLAALRDANESLHNDNDKLRDKYLQTQEELNRVLSEKQRAEKALREKNDECESLLAELIKAKMSVGDLSTELDELKRTLKLATSRPTPGAGPRASKTEGVGGGTGPISSSTSGPQPPQQPRKSLDGSSSGGPAPSRPNMGNQSNNNGNDAVHRRASANVPPNNFNNNNNNSSLNNGNYNNSGNNNINSSSNNNNTMPPPANRRVPTSTANNMNNNTNNHPIMSDRRTNDYQYSSASDNYNYNSNKGNNNDSNNSSHFNVPQLSRGFPPDGNYNRNNNNNNNNSNNNNNNNFNSNNMNDPSSYNNNLSNSGGGGGSVLMRGFNSNPTPPSPSNNTNSNVLMDGLGSLRRGFDSVSANFVNNNNSGTGTPATGAKRPPPSRPVF
jgi:hypothetical protein